MDIRKLIEGGLHYCGEVEAVRQTYYVFEANEYYFVSSFRLSEKKPISGNFNLIPKVSVDYVKRKFSGYTDVAAKAIVEESKRTTHAPNALAALNALYILVALGEAEIVGKGAHQQLFFYVH